MTRKLTNNQMPKKPNDFGKKKQKKTWQPKEHNGQAERINNLRRDLEGLKEGPKVELHIDLLKLTQTDIKLENVRQ